MRVRLHGEPYVEVRGYRYTAWLWDLATVLLWVTGMVLAFWIAIGRPGVIMAAGGGAFVTAAGIYLIASKARSGAYTAVRIGNATQQFARRFGMRHYLGRRAVICTTCAAATCATVISYLAGAIRFGCAAWVVVGALLGDYAIEALHRHTVRHSRERE